MITTANRSPTRFGFDYKEISGLSLEAQEKLNRVQPENIGQASRISGVSPADVSVLIIWLASQRG